MGGGRKEDEESLQDNERIMELMVKISRIRYPYNQGRPRQHLQS
jgi:hypothetical protein